jgi:hypothetical protein
VDSRASGPWMRKTLPLVCSIASGPWMRKLLTVTEGNTCLNRGKSARRFGVSSNIGLSD